MIVTEQKLVDTLRDQCNKAQKRIWVASPYVGAEKDVLRILGDQWKKDGVDCRILTDADAGIFGNDSFIAFKYAKASVHTLLSLHAKIYIVDDWCMISSANLTGTAFSKRYEIGDVCPEQIQDVVKLYEKWWEESTAIESLPATKSHDHRKYELEEGLRYSQKAKLPQLPFRGFDPEERGNLDEMIAWYLQVWDKYHPKSTTEWESYKWVAFSQAEEDFKNGELNLDNLLEKSFKLCGNLLAGNNFYPRRMLEKYNRHMKADIHQLFEALYDETCPLSARVMAFMSLSESLNEDMKRRIPDSVNNESVKSKQDLRAISVYLSLRYPDKHFLYKYDMYVTFLAKTKISVERIPFRSKEKLELYENFCRILRGEIKKDEILVKKCIETYGDHSFNLNLMTQDLMYCVARYHQ